MLPVMVMNKALLLGAVAVDFIDSSPVMLLYDHMGAEPHVTMKGWSSAWLAPKHIVGNSADCNLPEGSFQCHCSLAAFVQGKAYTTPTGGCAGWERSMHTGCCCPETAAVKTSSETKIVFELDHASLFHLAPWRTGDPGAAHGSNATPMPCCASAFDPTTVADCAASLTVSAVAADAATATVLFWSMNSQYT